MQHYSGIPVTPFSLMHWRPFKTDLLILYSLITTTQLVSLIWDEPHRSYLFFLRRKISRLSIFHNIYFHNFICDKLILRPLYVSSRLDHQRKFAIQTVNTTTFHSPFLVHPKNGTTFPVSSLLSRTRAF